ncbi:DNA polymerase III subunit psi [Pantoea sp. Aalb]|uniref:DNA polymerase III subunit psi n=1 Tax=Pantoea sp. Aalb TaxID=2576762 RepID=UPI001324EF03|nr:DNA polymerase III subunit psi [Pantoea sp. Aalb]MXP67852.1 DNA polymerase III subunit psi [Pantoea sp. Aalb]
MIINRNWFLQQMGITQYRLRRPHILKGDISVRLLPNIRLIIVTKSDILLNEPLICDVLQTLNIQSNQVMILTPEQLPMLPESIHCPGWLMGIESNHKFNGIILNTNFLNTLINSSMAKRSLWEQICTYENYFFK